MTIATHDNAGASSARFRVALWCAASIASAATSLALAPWGEREDMLLIVSTIALGAMYIVPGAMIRLRQPGNALGTALLLVGLLFCLLGLSGGTEAEVAGSDARMWLTLVTQGMWAPPIFILLSIVPLIFPNGALPSRRWRWGIWAAVIGSALVVVSSPFDPDGLKPLANPIGSKAIYDGGQVGAPIALAAVFAAIIGMVRRFRRARGTERDQLKLFVAGVVIAVFTMILNASLIAIIGEDKVSAWIEAGLLVLSASILSVTIGVAILRHKLFDINVVISKTLVYGLLAVIVTGLYAAFVVGIGALAGGGGEPNLGLSIAATAAAALVFQPLRARAQHLANRLVYGKRSTPYEALSHLSEQLGETYASEELLGHVAEILAQGTGAREASVWMRTGEVLWTAASWPPDLPARSCDAR